jgi:hypothetical protein
MGVWIGFWDLMYTIRYEWKAVVEDVYFDFNCINELYADVDVAVELGSLRVIKFLPPWCITHG